MSGRTQALPGVQAQAHWGIRKQQVEEISSRLGTGAIRVDSEIRPAGTGRLAPGRCAWVAMSGLEKMPGGCGGHCGQGCPDNRTHLKI
ncbi:MAG: hypothetical protein KF823_06855 [Xanthomonadales bacterium]|nr:hypothetical protein [Xanthomonadales bacterium]